MTLVGVEYEFFDFEAPSSSASELHRQIRLHFSDAPTVYASWSWKRQSGPDCEPYSIAYAESSHCSDIAARLVDVSASPLWSMHIGREIQLIYAPSASRKWEYRFPRVMKRARRTSRRDFVLPVQRKPIPHAFVLDALEPVAPETKPMFGLLAVYVKDRIVLILRDRKDHPRDNGVWLATTEEHHASLKREFPSMRSLGQFDQEVTGWQVLPSDADDFEEAALHACELIVAGDSRIGKVPGTRRPARLMSARPGRSKRPTST